MARHGHVDLGRIRKSLVIRLPTSGFASDLADTMCSSINRNERTAVSERITSKQQAKQDMDRAARTLCATVEDFDSYERLNDAARAYAVAYGVWLAAEAGR